MGAPIKSLEPEVLHDSDSDSNNSLTQLTQDIAWQVRLEATRAERARIEAMQINSPFSHPWWSYGGAGPAARCLDEWLIIELSWSIRSKNDWRRKYKDEEIANKWKKEITEQCKDRTKYIEEVIEYVFKELEWYEKIESRFMGSSGFEIGFNDYITTSDNAVAPDVKENLKAQVELVVAEFGDDLDYHPGSDEKVLDIVHPSLFPLQYDKTPIINDNNMVELVKYKDEIQYAKKHVSQYGVSKYFSWLPSLLKLEDNGEFSFKSYINNLHPVKHKDLYKTIEKVFNAIVPGLNYTLTRYASKEDLRINVPQGEDVYTQEYWDNFNEIYERLSQGGDEELEELAKEKVKYVVEVKPEWKEPLEFDKVIDVRSFENLKVVVKLANIQLTSKKPTYNGGSWHVEGTINEDIVATVLYYYDVDNISESRLSFRTGFEDPSYDQGDEFYLKYFYGIEDEDVMVRNIGSIEAKEDRVVIFPNMYQHHVDPFELKDKTKPGYRKILCFFIIDPYHTSVISTDKVPPQQDEWWNDEDLNYLYPGNTKEVVLQLKSSLGDDWPMRLPEANNVRTQLMNERSAAADDEDEYEELARVDKLYSAQWRIDSPFPHPWWIPFQETPAGPAARCLDEWLIMEVSWSIRSKSDWRRKYKDKEIANKWKKEITEQCKDRTKYIVEVIEYVFKELEWYEKIESRFMGSSGFEIGFNDYITTSDKAVDKELKQTLITQVSQVVAEFGDDLDYHPGSDEKVVDIVHPSLFPLKYNITPIVDTENVIKIPEYNRGVQFVKKGLDDYSKTEKFQWIPALLKVEDGKFCFKSYINNLHPVKHKDLYETIANIFNAIIPGLNYTLTRYASKEFLRINIPDHHKAYSLEYLEIREELRKVLCNIIYKDEDEDEDDDDDDDEDQDEDAEQDVEQGVEEGVEQGVEQGENEDEDEDEDDDDDEDQDEDAVQQEIDEFEERKSEYLVGVKPKWKEPPEFDKVIDVSSFENLKVIVKLANIQLTPDKPTYDGGTWHVEGTINEDIIATVLYYYDMDNISESRLSFRTGFEDPNYQQHDSFYPEYFYGLKDEDPMVRNIGSVEAKKDRVIIFPNMYQHHVDPFELKDKTKSGYRKILCFFIIDPYHTSVVSSDKVPPQQQTWWNDEDLKHLYPGNTKEDILKLKQGQTWPMSLEEAYTIRKEFMDERTEKPEDIKGDPDHSFARVFSFCEH
ncbi:hypothetical protein JA1_002383 [Spathaspora sp. JA1]|nr:hypothetical protein JA1_002383 [Spathaspora sp. JA1]